MRNSFQAASVVLAFALPVTASSVAGEEKKNEVFVNHGSIVLMEDDQVTKFITPKPLLQHGRFEIRIKRPKPAEPAPAVAPTLSERIEARRIMHEANQAYFSGDLTKCWDLVAKAEQLDPDFYRIKTMKGSLLYKIGSIDLAQEVWNESLAQNPDQPEIVQVIQSMKSKSAAAAGAMAKGETPTTKKKALQ